MEQPQDHSLNGTRFCSSCMWTQAIAGGVYILTQKGRGRRWKCAECLEREKERNRRKKDDQ